MKKMAKIKLLVILLLLCFLSSNLWAVTVQGRVVDSKGNALSYVSLYLKKNPQVGTISDVNGRFSFEIEDAHDSLIVTLVGYETVCVNLARVNLNKSLTIKLKDQPIMLNEVVVAVSQKDKKNKRMTKEDRLQLQRDLIRLRNRMEEDFPANNIRHHLVSTMTAYSGKEVVMHEEFIGDVVELRDYFNGPSDSIQLKPDLVKYYYNPTMRASLKEFNPEDYKKKDRKLVDKINVEETKDEVGGLTPHVVAWDLDMVKLIYRYYEDVKHWSKVEKDDETIVFTLTLQHKLPGIYTLTQKLVYAVDRKTYSVKTISERVNIDVSIPFGYKLSPAELALLNSFLIGDQKLDAYRVKKIHGTSQRNTIFKREQGQLVVAEKNFAAFGYSIDRHDKKLDFTCRIKSRTLSTETKGVKPFSAASLKGGKRVNIPTLQK